MKSRKKVTLTADRNSLLPAVIFCTVVFLLIIVSLLFRFIVLFKESKFSGKQQFVVGIMRDKTVTEVLSFDPNAEVVSELTFTGKSITSLQKFLGLHVDATIKLKKDFLTSDTASSQLLSLFWHKSRAQTELSAVDLLRLYQFAKMTVNDKVKSESITLPMDEAAMDEITADYLVDSMIDQEKISLGIVNGTGISGLGKRIERAMLTLGSNVTSVTTSRTTEAKSRLEYYGEKTYTVNRLEQIFHIQAEQIATRETSDIVLLLGSDKIGSEFY